MGIAIAGPTTFRHPSGLEEFQFLGQSAFNTGSRIFSITSRAEVATFTTAEIVLHNIY